MLGEIQTMEFWPVEILKESLKAARNSIETFACYICIKNL